MTILVENGSTSMSSPDRPDRHAPQKIDEKNGVFKSIEDVREA